MTTPRRGQVWTSAQLTARFAALRGLAPAVVQHVIYRATVDPTGSAREGYVVPGEARRLTPPAFDFWLAKRGLAGPERLSVAVLVIRERLAADGDILDGELEHRRGAADGPYHGGPARVTFTGPARLARFYQATPTGALAEVAPTPGPVAQPGIETDTAAIPLAVQACCGEGARILHTRQPTVIEAMVGITSVLRVIETAGPTAGQAVEREVACGILWHGPIAIALRADFPHFDVEPVLSTQQSSVLEALVAAEGLVACETRRDERGLAVLTRRRSAGDLLLVRFDGETAALAPYAPGRPAGLSGDQEQWLHYVETYEGLGVLDAYRGAPSNALIVLTAGADGAAWRHHVDIDGIETWRRANTGPALGPSCDEHTYQRAAADNPPPVSSGVDQPDRTASPFGPMVEARFPASAYDIDEAINCLVLRRPTASVFHCLRVVEQGLRAHAHWRGAAVAAPGQAERCWELILSDVRRTGCDPELFAALDAVHRGWGGTTLQVGQKYTEEEAARILRLVEAFMRCLANLCDEEGRSVVQPDDPSG
jgi:hypothetical protein